MPTATATASVTDDTGKYTGSLDAIARNAVAGFEAWLPWLAPSVGSIQIEVRLVELDDEHLASGRPGDIWDFGASLVFSGAALEINTGVDGDLDAPDIVIQLAVDFAARGAQLNPLNGSPLDPDKVDLVTVMAHELAHGLGFYGFLSSETYEPDPEYDLDGRISTFDDLVEVKDGAPSFIGDNAKSVYGGPVPLTRDSVHHIGNRDGAGAELTSDLMFTHASPGSTAPSRLDAAILSDTGVATLFDDTIPGSNLADTMFGGRGDDIMFASLADDVVSGDEGEDYLRGGDGNDSLDGGTGFDDLNGNAGDDRAFGGPGPDWVVGGKDNDLVSGDEGDDIVYGNLGADWCDGGAGVDIVRGGQGGDTLFGQEGDDWLSGDRDADTLSGGAGADVFHSFGEAGIDRVTDFSRAQGDRIQLDPGTAYTVAQSGADVVVSMTGGGQLILVGVQQSSLTGDWIFGA